MPNRKQKDCSKGKIYFVRSNNPEIKSKYVGSTIQTLAQRMTGHRGGYKRWLVGKENACAIFYEFQKYGIEQFHIELIEDYPCEREEQLLARENFFIRQEDCVNKIMAILTHEERDEKRKQYYQGRKNEVSVKGKEKIKCECGDIVSNSAGSLNRHIKTNKHKTLMCTKLKELDKKTITCVCGCEITQKSLSRHLKSDRHKTLIAFSI